MLSTGQLEQGLRTSDGAAHTSVAGAVTVKAAVLTAVERLHAAGYGRMYSGWPQGWAQVRPRLCPALHLHDMCQPEMS